MAAVQIAENIYWVGVVDWNVRNFHGHTYTTNHGTTYNAYLIIDEKITLVDTVPSVFADELIANIRSVIDPAKITYLIANHVEMDHSGALPRIHKLVSAVKVYGTKNCKDGLQKHYYIDNLDFTAVKSGDSLKLGKRSITFLEAPMLHWPDSMFSYIPEDALLLPNDAFGQHFASAARFNDEVDECVLMREAEKYYANILWPFSALVLKKIADVQGMNIPIKMIAPSHGVIWRTAPERIIQLYTQWAQNKAEGKKVVVLYETMWGSTERMARSMVEGLFAAGITAQLCDINASDRSEIITDLLSAQGILIGSSTHDNDMLPNLAGFLEIMKGLKMKNRRAAVFGSYGWGGGAIKEIEGVLKEAGIETVLPSLGVRYVPSPIELQQCVDFGSAFAKTIDIL